MITAKDIMTRNVITVKPETSIEELARILIENKISGAPVVDDSGNLVGIVTENDLINQNKRLHIPTVIRLFDAFIMLERPKKIEEEIKRITATRVWDICTKNVMTVNEDATIQEIATLMSEKKIHLIPVMRDKKVIGIIGKADIIKAMTKQEN
ncbi:MAG: CBS domain-containing protein [Thermodesulfovibrionales bacterium]|nr:CBS domain-containing protein [Thermodesulfovibrionales bacterium]